MCVEVINEMADTIVDLEKKLAEREWIPISEGLPKKDGEYIVTMGKDGFDKEGNVTWAMFNKLKKRFYFPGGRVNYYIAVIAWMPLPDAYKGREGD